MSRKIWNFVGGIHPPQNKSQSTQHCIEQAPIPDRMILPLQQHIGQPAVTWVTIGERVLKGQKVANPGGYVSAAIHAPTSGTVIAIGEHPIPHASGLSDICIEIEPDHLDEWGTRNPIADYTRATPAQLLEQLRESGIAGMGGAGFPTAVKLNPREDIPITHLIINAVECEPYISCDDMLMRERPEQVIRGIRILGHILKPTQTLIAIEDNKPEAAAALQAMAEELGEQDQIQIVRIPTKYPSGSEKQLITILTGLEVPNGGIPADIGVVCQNVATAASIHKAVELGEPLISRITTLTGDALLRRGNLEVMLGTPIDALLAHTGLQEDKLQRLIVGGPMMGFTLQQRNLPVIKTVNCILASTAGEMPAPAPEKACIRCGFCAQACPVSLLPQQLHWYAKSGEFDKALQHNLLDCIECGCCSYVCPSDIPLVQYYRFAKGQIRVQEHERTKSEQARRRFEFRNQRKEQEATEAVLAREARAKAVAEKKKVAKQAPATDHKIDDKTAAIAAALARVNAKKAQKSAQQAPANTPDSPGD